MLTISIYAINKLIRQPIIVIDCILEKMTKQRRSAGKMSADDESSRAHETLDFHTALVMFATLNYT